MTDRIGMRKEKGKYMRNRFYYLCRLNLLIVNSIHVSREGLLKSLQSIHHPLSATRVENPKNAKQVLVKFDTAEFD